VNSTVGENENVAMSSFDGENKRERVTEDVGFLLLVGFSEH
jgi:hypothetical protein